MTADLGVAPPAASSVADSRGVPLDQLDAASLDEALGRVLPKPAPAAPVPVASFQSSI